ncbi:MAG: CYTH domain-containing protein [Ruminococcaceae bacterium]|nr:CYTH domain-containing protein [Oscillospiraceae bacterium]
MEIEVKYAPVSYAQFVAIADDFGLTGEETVMMSANYFDTADGFLSENRVSLRNRTENNVSVYTMKCTLRNEGGVAVREEEEIATDDINVAFDHFAKNPRLAEIVEKCRKSELVSIAKMEFVRKKYLHTIYSTVVEISHDIGRMYGKNGGVGDILEMEIELKSGGEKGMAIFLLELEKYGLPVEEKSKLARAKML